MLSGKGAGLVFGSVVHAVKVWRNQMLEPGIGTGIQFRFLSFRDQYRNASQSASNHRLTSNACNEGIGFRLFFL
jgi:hypothetical protein